MIINKSPFETIRGRVHENDIAPECHRMIKFLQNFINKVQSFASVRWIISVNPITCIYSMIKKGCPYFVQK